MSISEKELVKTTLNVANKVDALRNAIQLVRDNMDYFSKIPNDDFANLLDHVDSILDTYEGIEDLLKPEELALIKELVGSFFLDASKLFRGDNKDENALLILESCIDILSRGASDTNKNIILADALFDMGVIHSIQESDTEALKSLVKAKELYEAAGPEHRESVKAVAGCIASIDSTASHTSKDNDHKAKTFSEANGKSAIFEPETNQKVDPKEMSRVFNDVLAPKLSMFLDRLPPEEEVMINICSYLASRIPIKAFLSLFENNAELSKTIKSLERKDFITVDKDSVEIFIDSLTQELVRNKLNRANKAVEGLEKAIQLVHNNMGGLSDTFLFDHDNSIVTNYEAIKNELNLEQQNIIDNLLLKLPSDAYSPLGDNGKDDYALTLDHCRHTLSDDSLDTRKAILLQSSYHKGSKELTLIHHQMLLVEGPVLQEPEYFAAPNQQNNDDLPEANPNILMQLNVKIGLLFKQMLYYNEIARLHAILREKNIDTHIDWENYPDFRKNVLFRLHPDKGGNDGDFTFAKELHASMNEDLNIQPIIHKASIGFKALDTVTDTIRLINEPNFANTKKVAFDFNYLYGIYSGVNSFSLVMSGADSLYQFTQGEYEQAVKQMVVTSGYMALPAMIAFANMPYIALAYGAVVNSYTIYHAGINTYSLYQEYNTIESQLKSAIAYKDLYNIFAGSPFQQIYDFASNAKLYEVRIKTISLEIEKAHVKQKLEAKEEFGNKLYKYIYVPMLEEKYGLLELKHATLKISGQYYEHCFSIISENNDEGLYTCYNMEEKIIDHVTIMNNGSAEIIGCL